MAPSRPSNATSEAAGDGAGVPSVHSEEDEQQHNAAVAPVVGNPVAVEVVPTSAVLPPIEPPVPDPMPSAIDAALARAAATPVEEAPAPAAEPPSEPNAPRQINVQDDLNELDQCIGFFTDIVNCAVELSDNIAQIHNNGSVPPLNDMK